MRNHYLVIGGIFLLSLFLASCSDEEFNKYNGDWKLVLVSGGVAGGVYIDDTNKMTIEGDDLLFYMEDELMFTADMDFEEVDETGRDKVSFDFDIMSEGQSSFPYNDKKSMWISEAGELIFDDGCCDQFYYIFEPL